MVLQPNSTINLYGGVEITAGHQIAFSTSQNQTAYFETKLKASMVNCTIIRKSGALRVSVQSSIIKDCNYLSFVNPNWDDKVIYARIIDYNYINNETTEILYQIDYFQTFMFDVEYEDMYIDREHLSKEDHDKAEVNPYDTSIFQFRTVEPLAISQDLEKLHYTIVDDYSEGADGVKLFEASSPSSTLTSVPGTLIYMSDIALDALDENVEGTETPSVWFASFLSAVIESGYGFYQLGVDSVHKGAEVPSGDFGSSMSIPYWIIYIPNSIAVDYTIDKLLNKLTVWGCVSSIINMYSLPISTAIRAVKGASGYIVNAKTSKQRQNVLSKKLLNFPFSYMRLIAPNGDKKELHYELFKGVQEGGNDCPIEVILDVIGRPSMIACPVNYKMSGQDFNESGDNLEEGLIFGQIPTSPYSTDAFLAQMAAYSQSIIGNNTTDYMYQLGIQQVGVSTEQFTKNFNLTGNLVNAAKSGLSLDFGGVGSNIAGSMANPALAELHAKQLENTANQSQQAYSALAGAQEGNAVYENYRETRPAYAVNKYVPSTGDGMLNYSFAHYLDIILLHVQLNESVRAQYDKFFQNYGYKSGRCGIPHVVSFMQNSQSDGELPEWVTLGGKQTTYVKTNDCRVVSSMLPVSTYIESLFNGGCRFINGDSLTGGE